MAELLITACRAVVATRLHEPKLEQAVLRALRVLNFSGHLLDETATLALPARAVEIDPDELARWMAEPATEEALGDARLERPARLEGCRPAGLV